MTNQLLSGKTAIIFGAGGSIGAAIAQEFSAEGASLFLAGRTKANLDAVVRKVVSGSKVHSELVDVLDDTAVIRFVDGVVKQAGRIDILIDVSGPLAMEYGNGKLAVDLPIEEFMVPLTTMVRSRFITARAAARHMVGQRSGVIVLVTGSPARPHVPGATAIGAAFGAMENLAANLAFELSPSGVRVVCLRTTANIDSRSIRDTGAAWAKRLGITEDQWIAQIAQGNFLKDPATVADTANAAVLVASNRARMLTGTVVNASAGAALD
jgi:NAD(P)-dependent dehydrogenase (short-subunit alcohol dehydrogenase family)